MPQPQQRGPLLPLRDLGLDYLPAVRVGQASVGEGHRNQVRVRSYLDLMARSSRLHSCGLLPVGQDTDAAQRRCPFSDVLLVIPVLEDEVQDHTFIFSWCAPTGC